MKVEVKPCPLQLPTYIVPNYSGSGKHFSPYEGGCGWGDGIEHARTDGSGGGSGFLHGGGRFPESFQAKCPVLLKTMLDTNPSEVALV